MTAEPLALVRVSDLEAVTHALGELRAEIAELRSQIISRETPEPAPAKLYLSPAELAKRLEVSTRTVRTLMASGLPCIRLSHTVVRIPAAQAEQWLAARKRL